MKKVRPSEKLSKEIDGILSGQVSEDEDVLGSIIQQKRSDRQNYLIL